MIKLFVSDIDGTLLDSNKNIKKSDIEAIVAMNESGIEFCLASGRMYSEIINIMNQIGGNYHAVCQNGASIYDKNGKLIAARVFNNTIIKSIITSVLLLFPELVTITCTSSDNYVIEYNNEAIRVGERFLTPLKENRELLEDIEKGSNITKLSIYGNVIALQKLLNYLNERFGDNITAFFSDPDGIDIMPRNVDKGSGIAILINSIGIFPDELACVGDSFNDLAMFNCTPNSFVMNKSHPELKQSAKFTVMSVAEAIKTAITL
ncbi:HAD family hydrolase [Paenibacillus psychroresistens]|uniref:HAD family hydrolase n=1 Tax=Paenibacillus psychroresistens TaxID=1778678 RepID=A0A6B8RIS6_9BACL|nr:HAD family hydrolase [Paenibacillus psychroresistens]QGQ95443.1 HAD family hydrolase [Paenibacillus psychroresistens]